MTTSVPRADPAQQLPGAGQRRPADLVAVGGRRPAARAPAARSAGGEQPERGGRAEPDRVAAVLARQSRGPAGDRAGWAAAPAVRLADHRERLLGVEAAAALAPRRRRRRPPSRRAGGPRSSCTKDWMPPGRGGKSLVTSRVRAHRPASRAYARAAAIRSTVDGWTPRSEVLPAGRVGVGQVRPRRAGVCIASKVAGSPVRREGVRVGAGLDPAGDERLHRAWRPAPGDRDHREQQRERARSSAIESTPAAAQQRRPASRAGRARPRPVRRPARRSACRSSTSRSLAWPSSCATTLVDLGRGWPRAAACRRRRSAGSARGRRRTR